MKNNRQHAKERCFALFLIVSIAIAATAVAAEKENARPPEPEINAVGRPLLHPVVASLSAIGGSWSAQGPSPILNGQIEGITNRPVVGAVKAVVAHPTNANILWVGTVNGGVWKTTNALSGSPTWTPETDTFSSLSIGTLVSDPTDFTSNTLVAGMGANSSFGTNGPLGSLLRTTDGGASWSASNPTALAGKGISGIAARGSTIVVSTPTNSCSAPLYRSTDAGATFSTVSGLPSGYSWHLVGDPTNNAVLYAAIEDCFNTGSGIYKSTDTGVSWTRVSNTTMNNLFPNASNAKIAVGSSGQVYAGIISGQSGQLSGLFRSGDNGSTWTQLDTPTTTENGTVYGIHPGRQGGIHFSLVADPSMTGLNLVYVGGDRQPAGWPNSLGATDYDGRLFRVNAAASPGSQATSLTHCQSATAACNNSISTSSNSAPHADSRSMTFDANGNLLETDDGGIYRRTTASGTGDWFSVNGSLQVSEMHDVAYDHVSKMIMGGDQDTGTPEQTSVGGTTWTAVLTADGGDVAADDITSITQSTRYGSYQYLGSFFRRIMNSSGVATSWIYPSLTLLGGANLQAQFSTPVELNRVDARRALFAGNNDLYESLDGGDTITGLGLNRVVKAMTYGGRSSGVNNLDVIWAISFQGVYVRTSGGGAPVQTATAPGTASLNDIAADLTDWHKAYVVNQSGQVFSTSDTGNTWTDITGNLGSGATDLRTIVFIPGSPNLIAVGGLNGVFRMATNNPGVWNQLGTGLPSAAIVQDMDYDPVDDVLVAGTLGRGAWKLSAVSGGDFVAAPTNVLATATTTTNVNVSWTNVSGASSYRVYRSSGGGNYIQAGGVSGSPFNDSTASPNTAYLYKVRAVTASGTESTDSNIDLATTVIFTDPTITTGTTLVKAAHFTELLTAVNAVRALAGFGAIGFTTPAPGLSVIVLGVHISDLRNGLNPARATLGLTAQTYTDPTIVPQTTLIKATHITELRTGVQ